MDFRPATPADVPHVLPLLRAQYALHVGFDPTRFTVRQGWDEGYGRWLVHRAADDRAVFLVAATDSPGAPPVAGFVIGTIEHELPLYVLQEYGFLHDIYVHESYRHEGIGRQLVSLAVERFREMGIAQVRCETAYVNDIARSLFVRCGFRPATVDMMIDLAPDKPESTR